MIKFLLCFVVLGATARDFDLVKPSPKLVTLIQKVSHNCITEVNAPPESLKQFLVGTYKDDQSTRDFMYCFLTKGQFSDSDGFLIKDNIVSVAGKHKKTQLMGKVIEQCNEDTVDETDKFSRVYLVSQCFHKKSPIKFEIW